MLKVNISIYIYLTEGGGVISPGAISPRGNFNGGQFQRGAILTGGNFNGGQFQPGAISLGDRS